MLSLRNFLDNNLIEMKKSNVKDEKSLPFRKRSHRQNTEVEEKLESRSIQRRSKKVQSPVIPIGQASSSNINEAGTSRVQENTTGSEINNEFQNLQLLAEVTTDLRTDTTEGNINIPVTVESIPSTSRTDTKKVTLKCTFCNKNFHHKGDMNKHMRSHTKEQPFNCKFCSLKFSHTSNLQRHLRIHTGSKPYSCEQCNRTFSRIDKLHLHHKNGSCRKKNS